MAGSGVVAAATTVGRTPLTADIFRHPRLLSLRVGYPRYVVNTVTRRVVLSDEFITRPAVRD